MLVLSFAEGAGGEVACGGGTVCGGGGLPLSPLLENSGHSRLQRVVYRLILDLGVRYTRILHYLVEPLMEEGVKRFPRFPHLHHSPAFFCRSGGVRYPRVASPRPAQVRLLHHCVVLLLSYAGEV
jgi:hypothetical protein